MLRQWRPVHVGPAGNGLRIGNVEVWRRPWRPVGIEPVELPHPNQAGRTDRCAVYEAADAGDAVRFAAGQAADSTWAFHVPADQTIFSPGASVDRSLRYEHRLGAFVPGHYDFIATTATLIDASSGAVLADTADWNAGFITGNPDGSLFLRLQQIYDEVLFRIDPMRRTFCDQGMAGADQPLSRLPDAISEARAATGRQPVDHRISPDGSIRVDLVAVEWMNSLWVHSPIVTDIAGQRVVLDLAGSDWDASVSFPDDRSVRLHLRRFHRRGMVWAELDLARDTYRLAPEADHDGAVADEPLAQIADGLEAWSCAAAAAAAPNASGHMPNAPVAWRAALIILIGALAAVALATSASLYLRPPAPKPALSAIPRLTLPAREPQVIAGAVAIAP